MNPERLAENLFFGALSGVVASWVGNLVRPLLNRLIPNIRPFYATIVAVREVIASLAEEIGSKAPETLIKSWREIGEKQIRAGGPHPPIFPRFPRFP